MTGRVCPQCGGKPRLQFNVADINRRITEATFAYVRCQSCGVVYLADPPTDLGHYYAASYYSHASTLEELARWAESERYKLDLVRRFRVDGHLVEVGPASGSFLYLAWTAGFEATAIEMDARSAEVIAAMMPIEVLNTADEASALGQTHPADVIAMWQVIEHLVDPWTMLEAAADRLKPGGVLIIAAPNPRFASVQDLPSALGSCGRATTSVAHPNARRSRSSVRVGPATNARYNARSRQPRLDFVWLGTLVSPRIPVGPSRTDRSRRSTRRLLRAANRNP